MHHIYIYIYLKEEFKFKSLIRKLKPFKKKIGRN